MADTADKDIDVIKMIGRLEQAVDNIQAYAESFAKELVQLGIPQSECPPPRKGASHETMVDQLLRISHGQAMVVSVDVLQQIISLLKRARIPGITETIAPVFNKGSYGCVQTGDDVFDVVDLENNKIIYKGVRHAIVANMIWSAMNYAETTAFEASRANDVKATDDIAALRSAFPEFHRLLTELDPTCPVNVTVRLPRPGFLIRGDAAYLKRFDGFPAEVAGVPVYLEQI